MRVLICGGGAIGASLAWFLARRGAQPVVIESSGVANAASGKAGGFLALDWCDGSALEALARRSFALHDELAAERVGKADGDWGYRRVDTLQVVASERGDVGGYRRLESPPWLAGDTAVQIRLGGPETTAQVHPAGYTRGVLAGALEHGADLVEGRVTGLVATPDGSAVTGVELEGRRLDGDAVVIAMGPWSALACAWLPLPGTWGRKGHSIVFRYVPPGPPTSLFVAYEDAEGRRDDPEVFPRADGTTYVCGLGSDEPLPVDPAEVGPDPGAHERLRAIVEDFAPELGRAEILSTGTCHRPITQDGLPLMGRVPGVEGAYVATGHSVWGILNAPASGEAMAELILDGVAALDLTPFDPARLPAARLGR